MITTFSILAMDSFPCYECLEIPIELEWEDKQHIIDRHFNQRNDENISFFYRDISVRMVLEKFKAMLRAGILRGELGRFERLIYHCPFDDGIGTFPIEHPCGNIERCETRYVRVICDTIECRNCGRLVPTWVVTMFPKEFYN